MQYRCRVVPSNMETGRMNMPELPKANRNTRMASRLVFLLCLAGPGGSILAAPGAQTAAVPGSRPAPGVTAIENVRLIPLDRDGLIPGQTVLVQGDLILGVGPAGSLLVPENARRIDGAGRCLLPGLTDAHVHLDRMVGARRDFGDAPLFLAYGVTTVFNLRGTPEELAWKDRIRQGTLLAPNLYTAGEFVNEPRIRTPEEAEREIHSQTLAGYDIIKFREVIDFEQHRVATTTGLEWPAYLRLNEAARQAGVPLVGHAPYRTGLDGLLAAGQSMAHVNELANLHFLPRLDLSGGSGLLLAEWSWLALLAMTVFWTAGLLAVRRKACLVPAPPVRWMLRAGGGLALLSLPVAGLWLTVVAPGWFFGNVWLLLFLTGLCLLCLLLAGVLVRQACLLLRTSETWPFRVAGTLTALAATGLTAAFLLELPFAWRSSNWYLDRVARRCKESGLWMQSTLVLYETGMGRRDGYSPRQLAKSPAFRYLPADLQEGWKDIPGFMPPWMSNVWYRHPEFTRKLAGALHRAGVPFMAGTDALGVPLVIPGESLHRELQLLTESGFSNEEALRAATVNPARFLRREKEFGTIAPGRRADLLLVEGNPLEDLRCLERPAGVMVRGIWLPRGELDRMLAELAAEAAPDQVPR